MNCVACDKPDESCKCLEAAFKDTAAWLRHTHRQEQLDELAAQFPDADCYGGSLLGTFPITRTATVSSPLEPGRVWQDGNRWRRNKGTHPEQSPDFGMPRPGKGDRQEDELLASPLVDLYVATGGGYDFEEFSNPHQLEVCRLCGEPLPEGKREYCSKACWNTIRAARGRAARSTPWVTALPKFSLDSITFAGVGKLEVSPAGWNRTDKSEPHVRSAPQPWFVPNTARHLSTVEVLEGWTGSRSALRLAYGDLRVPPDVVDAYRAESHRDTRTLSERADRLVRRWGTGGTPPVTCAAFGCQVVPPGTGKGRAVYCSAVCREAGSLDSWETVWFRFPASREVSRLNVVQPEPGVWKSDSLCESPGSVSLAC
jgi:hypothetical protein